MTDYAAQRAWSDRYIPEIKKIIGPLLLVEAPEQKDRKEATDLIILTARNLDIACRVRKPKYYEEYPFEFTIRKAALNGGKTEWDKIREGFGHWMFYGFAADESDPKQGFLAWYVIDLNILRATMIDFSAWSLTRATPRPPRPFCSLDRTNGDNSALRGYDLRTFMRRDILIASSCDIPWIEMAAQP